MRYTGIIIVRLILIFCCFSAYTSSANLVIGSWNLENFGEKKGERGLEIIAESLKDMDVVAIQEVLISKSGAAAVAKLAEALNRKGYKWDYVISEVTTSDNAQKRERYAFLWKPSRVKLRGKPVLATHFESEICREPFLARFEFLGKQFTLVNFHAVPKKKQPETELRYFLQLTKFYPQEKLIFLGDFNCPQSDTVFNGLRNEQYRSVFTSQKTTLRQDCKGEDCLASEYDNIFYPVKMFRKTASGTIPFHSRFFGRDMISARKISDHLPIFASFEYLSN